MFFTFPLYFTFLLLRGFFLGRLPGSLVNSIDGEGCIVSVQYRFLRLSLCFGGREGGRRGGESSREPCYIERERERERFVFRQFDPSS